jgi:hypothetical protein
MNPGTVRRMRSPITDERPNNNLLNALRADDYRLLSSKLSPWDGQAGKLLYNPGDNVDTIYFPCGPSLASFLVSNEDGHDVETILIGREGAVGGIVSLGNLPAYTRVIVQFSGPFVRLKVADLEAAKRHSPTLRHFFARYADCLLAQILQSTACNATHNIEQRAAKWIVSALERTGEKVVPLTQEQLASMLGVGRSYTSRIIKTFKNEGILTTRRGSLDVLDLEQLTERACLCNQSVKNHFEVVLAGVYPQKRARPSLRAS